MPERGDKSRALLELLREHPEGRTPAEMAKELHYSYKTVYGLLTTISIEEPVANEGSNYFLIDRWAL